MSDKSSVRKKAESIVDLRDAQVSQNLEKLSFHETQVIVHELEVYQIELELQNEELHKTHRELEKTKERYFDLYDMAPVGYCTLNKGGFIEEMNLSLNDLLGYDRNILMMQSLSHLITPEDEDIYYFFRKKILASQEKQECEVRMTKEDKSTCWVHLIGVKEVDTVRLIVKDISKRKKLAEELKDKEEMMLAQSKQAAMGEMIEMIAHQWKQPLGIISMDVNNLDLSMSLEEEITRDSLIELISSINKQVHQLSETIDNFRNFFEPQHSKELVSIDAVFKDILNIIGTSLTNNDIRLNIHNNVSSSFYIYKSSLTQVLLNIIGNAKDALLINKVPDASIDISIEETKEFLTISICDNAGGISESIMDKLDQPYFTTKKSLNGTGLGLYICRTILEKHFLGTLSWYNQNRGACFTITFKELNHG